MRRYAAIVVLAILPGCIGGLGPHGLACGFGVERAPATVDQAGAFTSLRDRYFIRTLQWNPVTATYLGADEYSADLRDVNGRLRDYTDESLAQEIAFYRKTQQELRGIDPSMLPPRLSVDYRVMDAHLKFLLHNLSDRKYYQRAIDTYTSEPFRGMDWQLQGLSDAGGSLRGTEGEWKLVVTRLKAIPRYLAVARTNLLAGKASGNLPDRRMVQIDGIQACAANEAYFRKGLPANAVTFIGERPFAAALLPEVKESAERAAAAWDEFAKFLNATFDIKETIDRYAAGNEEYEWRVHNVLNDPRSAAELYDYGARQVAFYSGRLQEIARVINPGAKTVLEVATRLADDAPSTDAEMYQWYRSTADRAVTYGRERGLFDIPASYKLDIVPTPEILN